MKDPADASSDEGANLKIQNKNVHKLEIPVGDKTCSVVMMDLTQPVKLGTMAKWSYNWSTGSNRVKTEEEIRRGIEVYSFEYNKLPYVDESLHRHRRELIKKGYLE